MKKLQFEATPEGNMLHTLDNVIRATVPVPEGASEDYGYLAMKNAILAAYHGTEPLAFWYDGQEATLNQDAWDGTPTVEIEEEDRPARYTIKPEYLTLWGEDVTEDTVIDAAEVERLAQEWGKPMDGLLEQLEEAYWYAVMTGPDDTDWGTGSYVLSEAKDKVLSYRESGYPDAYIAVISDDDDPICVREIHEF